MESLNSNKDGPRGLVPIGVFWDIENCQVPRGKSATALVGRIRHLFFRGHAEAEFLCVCDIRKELPEVVHELNLAQVTVVHINAVSKNAADDKLKQCMRRFVDIHGSPATLVLISGDVNFSTDLSDFRHRRQIHVVLLHGRSAPEALTACAHESYSFVELASTVPFRTPRREDVHCLELMVTNLPAAKSPRKVRTRLKQLSENCGGRVSSLNGGTAVLTYPTTNAALRSRIRMDGENVCGNAISVNLHKPRRRRSRSGQNGANRSSSSSSRSPESSSVEADNYQLSKSRRRTDTFPVVDTWNPDLALPSLVGPQAPMERPRSVGWVSPLVRSSSQAVVSAVYTSTRAQVVDTISTTFVNQPSACGILGGYEGPPIGALPQGPRRCPVDAFPRRNPQNVAPDGGTLPLELRLQDVSLSEPYESSTCIRVTNLDPSIDIRELRSKLLALFEAHVTVLNIVLTKQRDGAVRAYVNVPNAAEAMRAFKLINQRRLGLYCLHLSVDDKVLVQTGVPLYCPVHDNAMHVVVAAGTPNPSAKPLPEMCLPRATWMTQLMKLLDVHDDSLHLDSFKACYRAEFGALPVSTNSEKWQAGNVPLEHLVASVPGISIVTSKRGFKQAKRDVLTKQTAGIVKGSSTETLALEMVELLSSQPHCRVEVGRFSEVYQAHFSRHFCALDYGRSRVVDAMATIPEIVEVLGHGYHSVITLTHKEQMKRFTWDVERLFKTPDVPRTMSMFTLLRRYQNMYERPLEVADYGVCTLDDLLEALPSVMFVVERKDGNIFISYPEPGLPDPTMEQAERLRMFARELVHMLSPTGDRGIPLCDLGLTYERTFGRPLCISNYLPCGNLLNLIQAISDVVQLDTRNNWKVVLLAPSYQHRRWQRPLVSKEETSQAESLKSRREEECILDLLSEPISSIDLAQLWEAFHNRCGSYPNLALLRGLERDGCILLNRNVGHVQLSPLYQLAWQLRRLLYSITEPGEEPKTSLDNLEFAYIRRYSKLVPVEDLGFQSVEELLISLPKYFTLSWDRGTRVVSVAEADLLPSAVAAEPSPPSPAESTRTPSPAHGSDDTTTNSFESTVEQELLELCTQSEQELMQLCAEPGPGRLPERELLELFPPSDDDLLNRPIPSSVPSPVIQPEVALAENLIWFDAVDYRAGPRLDADSAEHLDSVATPAKATRKKRIAAMFPVPLSQ